MWRISLLGNRRVSKGGEAVVSFDSWNFFFFFFSLDVVVSYCIPGLCIRIIVHRLFN